VREECAHGALDVVKQCRTREHRTGGRRGSRWQETRRGAAAVGKQQGANRRPETSSGARREHIMEHDPRAAQCTGERSEWTQSREQSVGAATERGEGRAKIRPTEPEPRGGNAAGRRDVVTRVQHDPQRTTAA
jgi:hypothetical protein